MTLTNALWVIIIFRLCYLFYNDRKKYSDLIKIEKESGFTLKAYNSIDEVLLSSWQSEDNTLTLDDLKNAEMGCHVDESGITTEYSYEDQKEGIESMGYWGWIDDKKVIHYWIGKDVKIEKLIHFFAHEIGHRTGTADNDFYKEEMRAEAFGDVASLAYSFAKHIKK